MRWCRRAALALMLGGAVLATWGWAQESPKQPGMNTLEVDVNGEHKVYYTDGIAWEESRVSSRGINYWNLFFRGNREEREKDAKDALYISLYASMAVRQGAKLVLSSAADTFNGVFGYTSPYGIQYWSRERGSFKPKTSCTITLDVWTRDVAAGKIEAYVDTTGIPGGLHFKNGIFRAQVLKGKY